MFPSSTKREFRHFHVVVVQRRQRNVSKSVIHVQSCCFAYLNLLLFCCSRCRRRRRCLSSLVASASSYAVLPGAPRHPRLRLETELNLQWRIQGRGLGGPGPPSYFQTKLRPEGSTPPSPPLISRSGSGTDLSSDRLKFSDRICNWPLSGYCMAAIITLITMFCRSKWFF